MFFIDTWGPIGKKLEYAFEGCQGLASLLVGCFSGMGPYSKLLA